MIGNANADLKRFTFKILTGKELRRSLKGLHDSGSCVGGYGGV